MKKLLIPLLCLLIFSGCAGVLAPSDTQSAQAQRHASRRASPRLYFDYASGLKDTDVRTLLESNPMPPDMNIFVVDLGTTTEVSHHVVFIRAQEPLHKHEIHDITATLIKGAGILTLNDKQISLTTGDTVFIPRASPHFYTNTDPAYSAVLAVFSPPYDGKDVLAIESEKNSE